MEVEHETNVRQFLYDYQFEAVRNMQNGCILNGGVGSGKSRTALYYYFKEQGGSIDPDYVPMKNPKDLYIITTARKRDTLEWEGELANFLLSTHEDKNELYSNKRQIVGHTQMQEKPYITSKIACLDVRQCFMLDTEKDEIMGIDA